MAHSATNDVAVVIADLLQRGQPAPQLARSVAAFLIEQRQSSQLDAIMRRVVALQAQQGIVSVAVLSAHKLSAANRTALRSLVAEFVPGATDFIWHYALDPECIGGIQVSVAGLTLEATIRSQLAKLTQV